MTPEQFITLWKNNPLTERAGAQAHFDDLCDLLSVAKPRDPENYCFERGAKKSTGGDGWADVWKRNHFGWENKKPGRALNAALKQLTDYALQLDNPPLLVVCDRERIVIHTAFTGYPDEPRDTAPVAGQASPPCLAGQIVAENIAAAARRLNELREAWLNPAEWVDWVITPEEEKAGFPRRPVAKPGHEADLKKRTLTNLYNARPAWLDLAHKQLDQAVAAAYGWPDYTPEMPDDEILRRLLALNLERSKTSHVE